MRLSWTASEERELLDLYSKGTKRRELCARLGRSYNAIDGKLKRLMAEKASDGSLPESIYPIYDRPLEHEGDALVLPDPEFPFHHAEFVNRCLDLAAAWGLSHCVIAGDALHFNSLSAWEPAWSIEQMEELAGPNLGLEIRIASGMLQRLAEQFESIDYVLGNHEGRLIRTMGAVFSPDWMLRLLGLGGKWRISPFYFSHVISGGERFAIEHPKNTAKAAAQKLTDKYQCHVLMAHSHKISMLSSMSGQWMGWQIGACVDERRLPYAAQRHNTGDPHHLGAAIIRDGYVWVLSERWTDWERLKRAT